MQELRGGKFGEMSTFVNYTFQSFNFRNRQGARPFYDLVANIAAEEFGHIEPSRPRSTRCSPVRVLDGSLKLAADEDPDEEA